MELLTRYLAAIAYALFLLVVGVFAWWVIVGGKGQRLP